MVMVAPDGLFPSTPPPDLNFIASNPPTLPTGEDLSESELLFASLVVAGFGDVCGCLGSVFSGGGGGGG